MRIEHMVHMQTAVVFETDLEMSESVASIAGAIADAVREGISRTLNTQQPSQNAANVTSSGARQPGTSTPSTLYQRVSTITSGTSQHAAIPSRTQSAPIVSGDFHSDTTTGRKRYAAPTMFRAKRSRKNDARPKVVTYLRDIFCLPEHCEDRFGNVQIPRDARRTAFAKNDVGLLGKIEFKSDWSAEKMRREVCCVFAKPFGLTKEDIEEGGTTVSI